MAKNKPLTPREIESAIYGENGLYDRVIIAMNKERTGIIARKLEISSQQVDSFKGYKKDGVYSSKPKLETIAKYAKGLGVE